MNLIYLALNKWDHFRFWMECRKLSRCDLVVDIGCGERRQTLVKSDRYKGFDPVTTGQGWEEANNYLHDVKKYTRQSVTVTLLDVVEHLPKQDSLHLLVQTLKASDRIVVFTPYGFLKQNDGEYNTHQSGWYPEDFKGWDVTVFPYYHWCDFQGVVFDKPKGAILAVYTARGSI